MNHEILYVQCRLEKRDALGRHETMKWIPQDLAVMGTYIKRRVNGVMDDGWRITASSGPAYRSRYISSIQRTLLPSIEDSSCF